MEAIYGNHAAHGDQTAKDRGLGRIASFDPRDKRHLMAAVLQEEGFDPAIRKREWEPGPTLDQNGFPACVGFSLKELLLTGPVKNTDDIDPLWMYREIQKVDEWPGEDYEGTSVRAGMKFLQGLGYFKEYKWAFDAESAVLWVLNKGPIDLGTTWYAGMSAPDNQGFVHPTGAIQGGHAYCVDAAERDKPCPDGTKGAARIHQTWGTAFYGLKGFAWISFQDMHKLILDNGEACTPTEIVKGAPEPQPEPEPQPHPFITKQQVLSLTQSVVSKYERDLKAATTKHYRNKAKWGMEGAQAVKSKLDSSL